MTTDAETIASIKTAALARILVIQSKVEYNVDGQQVMWAAELKKQQDLVTWCDQQLAAEDPFETESQAIVE